MVLPSQEFHRAKFGPVGQCIYCGATDPHLTAEHIVPYSLDGNVELLDASCPACCVATCKIEGVVAGRMWGQVRTRHAIQTRRKKSRPKSLPAIGIKRGAITPLDLPVDQHGAPMPLLFFDQPGILAGRPPYTPPATRLAWIFSEAAAPRSLGFDEVRYKTSIDPKIFGRFLAKVAHGFTVAMLGVDGFKPLLRSIILNEHAMPFHLVGGDLASEPPADMGVPNNGHLSRLHLATLPDGRRLTVLRLRLFANWCAEARPTEGMPTYWIVTGEVNERTVERSWRAGPFYPQR